MSPTRKISFTFGVLFLITFVTSIPAVALYQPVLDDPVGDVAGGGSDTRIFLGATLELLLILANIGTAVVVYPLLKRQNHVLSLGDRLRPASSSAPSSWSASSPCCAS